jgi:peroxiredoxin Q/BCP
MIRTLTAVPASLLILLSFGLSVANEPVLPATANPPDVIVGESLPELESIDEAGQQWKSVDHVGRSVLVMYFYPGDFTGGCIKQAQALREGLARLEGLGVRVVGVSGDEVATHQLFKDAHGLKHTLLADPQGALAQRLDIPVQRPGKPIKVRTRGLDGKPLMDEKGKSIIVERKVTLPRWTLIVGRDGKLISKRTHVDPAKDAEEVSKLVEALGRD